MAVGQKDRVPFRNPGLVKGKIDQDLSSLGLFFLTHSHMHEGNVKIDRRRVTLHSLKVDLLIDLMSQEDHQLPQWLSAFSSLSWSGCCWEAEKTNAPRGLLHLMSHTATGKRCTSVQHKTTTKGGDKMTHVLSHLP